MLYILLSLHVCLSVRLIVCLSVCRWCVYGYACDVCVCVMCMCVICVCDMCVCYGGPDQIRDGSRNYSRGWVGGVSRSSKRQVLRNLQIDKQKQKTSGGTKKNPYPPDPPLQIGQLTLLPVLATFCLPIF